MASAFHVLMDRENDNLYLELVGHFDVSAAEELVLALKKNCTGVSKVFIDTNSLSRVYSLGRAAFRRKLQILSEKSVKFFLIGDLAEQLAPDWAQVL